MPVKKEVKKPLFPVKKTSTKKKSLAEYMLPEDQLKAFRKAEKEKEDKQKLVFCKWLLDKHGLKCVPEVKFHPTRKWRTDYMFYGKVTVALEVEGKVFGGRHTNPLGFIADIEKYNTYTELGIYLLRCQTKDLDIYKFHVDTELLRQLKAVLL